MAGNGPFNAYIDVATFLASAPSAATSGILGANTSLASASAVGASTLTVDSSQGVTPGQPLYLFDGPNTEIVRADPTNPTPTATSIALATGSTTRFAHSAGVNVATGGPRLSLPQFILQACGWVENYCQQGVMGDRSLLSHSRTERLRMPSTRAKIDPWYSLAVRPRAFPISAVTALAIDFGAGATQTLDTSAIELDATGRSFVLPYVQPLGLSQGVGALALLSGPPVLRGDQAWCVVTYTAGFVWPNLPWNLQTATCLATQEYLAALQNPTGAAMIRQGDVQISQRLRGSGGKESSAYGLFMSQAMYLLEELRNTFI